MEKPKVVADTTIIVVRAKLPQELSFRQSTVVYGCDGDGCNEDQGGCDSDAGCGQDC